MNEEVEIIDFECSDEAFLRLAKMAHEQDITFNKLIENILKEYVKKESAGLV